MSGSCPADALEPAGTVCRASAGACDPAEVCDGVSAGCPADALEPAGTVCRASTGECDPQEVCDGATPTCPADSFVPDGTTCTDDGLGCTNDFCQAGVCTHPIQPAGIVCRPSAGECDVAETCDGVSTTCPADGFVADGTACTDDGNACTSDTCQTGACTHTDTTPAGQCCDPGTGGLTQIDDGDPCTLDTCDTATGNVSHTPGGTVDVNLKVEALSNAVTRNVSFDITTCGGTVDSRTVPVSFNSFGIGAVSLANVDAAAAWISVREGHTLRRLASLTFSACSAAVDLSGANLLTTGDLQTAVVPQDNLVDITDFSILATNWNQAIDPTLSTGADVNGDGLQDALDFSAFTANFFVVGDPIDSCPAPVVGKPGGRTVQPGPQTTDGGLRAMKASVPVSSLRSMIPQVDKADLNGDGVIDTTDIRLFARQHQLDLPAEFQQRVDRIKSGKGRRTSRR
ncbi:MAG: hypothetical protein D6788_03515 [Planctomycetota bacterium]|nr:MAG: hypothetical protein D6788_03515 [Planctomycetota bacterium]